MIRNPAGRSAKRARVLARSVLTGLLAGAGVAAAAGLATAGTAAAATSHSGGAVVVRQPTHVTLAAAVPAVKPGVVTQFVATVAPASANRAVTLKEFVGGRFLGLTVAMTDATGVAHLSAAFPTQGNVALRAFVAPTSGYKAAISPRALLKVATVLPLDFGALTRLSLGNTGNDVLLLQQRLSALGYWLGTPNGVFGDTTQQAVYALQKVAGLTPTGIVGPLAEDAINRGVLPHPRTTSGNAIDVDLTHDLVMFVQNGKLAYVLNTSTGGGYTYVQSGVTNVATTPTGVFAINRVVDGMVVDSLGSLWRPRFFYEGFAIHGDSYVPSVPVSHGCVRVSNEAIDWIWANNLAPYGDTVWVY
ncbi:MAG: putative peptidoglycan binding protein [Acidimicrobiaceae bacterium]|nr:putative peptidoglycan binding protein [Acidimicrobiaceae bacterium]